MYLRNVTTCGKKIKVFSGNTPPTHQKQNSWPQKTKFSVGSHGGCLLSYQSTNSQITDLLLFSDTSALQCKIVLFFFLIRILQKALRLLAFVCTAWEFSFKVFTLFLKFSIFVFKIVTVKSIDLCLGFTFQLHGRGGEKHVKKLLGFL